MAETVLIVDDDPAHRRHLDGVIQGLGYQTIAVESGDKAVSLLMRPQAAAVDAIVLDLVMPDLDGLGVLARMREQNLRIPVIVQAANGGIDNIADALKSHIGTAGMQVGDHGDGQPPAGRPAARLEPVPSDVQHRRRLGPAIAGERRARQGGKAETAEQQRTSRDGRSPARLVDGQETGGTDRFHAGGI